MNPSSEHINDYTHYLQSQLEKFSSFIVTQNKLNRKHLLIQSSLDQFIQRLNRIQSKLKIFEINQNDNLLELQKIKTEKEVLKSMELRIQNIQFQISSLLKNQENLFLNQTSENLQNQERNREISSSLGKQSNVMDQIKTKKQLQKSDFKEIQKYLSTIFIEKDQVNSLIEQVKDNIELKIKKIQVQIDKNKQSFLKMASNFNNLSNINHSEGVCKKQFKGADRFRTQSTKDLSIEPITQQNIITKKQLRKMQKKLENFFSQKISQIKSHKQNLAQLGSSHQKALKFNKVQDNKKRIATQSLNHSKSSKKIIQKDHSYSSHKKLSLFQNQILRQRHNIENHEDLNKNKKNGKQRNFDIEAINIIQSPKKNKGKENTKANSKNLSKKKSAQRIKKFNSDYMITN